MLSGQVLSSENQGCFLVLNGHKWGTLTWPLTVDAEDAHGLCRLSLSVDTTLGANWMFITNPSDFVAWPYEVIWSPESGIRLQTTSSNGEALIKNSIRKPQAFVFADLCRMGAYLGIERSDRLPREQLLRTIADIVSEGDEDFISMVIDSDKKKKVLYPVKGLNLLNLFSMRWVMTFKSLMSSKRKSRNPRKTPKRLSGKSGMMRNVKK